MKLLSIDHGTKFIGLAYADTSQIKMAIPHSVLANDENTLTKIANIVKKDKINLVVLGLPRNLSGEETAQSDLVRDFAASLSDILPRGVDIVFQDETLSSVFALEQISGGASRSKSKPQRIDDQAAAIILQDYLEGI